MSTTVTSGDSVASVAVDVLAPAGGENTYTVELSSLAPAGQAFVVAVQGETVWSGPARSDQAG